jgi:putative flippase GtrA
MSFFTNKQERIRFLKFAFVGVTGTIVDFGLMNLFSLAFKIPLIWAQAMSFIIAVINNFLWNRFWTYPDSRSKAAHRQLLQFFLINLVGIAIRTPLIAWLNKAILNSLTNSTATLPLGNTIISQNLALALSVGVIMLWNFFANRYWTYSDVPVGAESKLRPGSETQPGTKEQD